jgi:hypothetical protein
MIVAKNYWLTDIAKYALVIYDFRPETSPISSEHPSTNDEHTETQPTVPKDCDPINGEEKSVEVIGLAKE